jgi:hypothetical protein
MAFHYNRLAHRVTYSDILSVTLLNTVITKNVDENGGYVFEGYHTTGGCGTAQDSGFLILLRDDIAWTKMCFKWEGTGTASCWSFCTTYAAQTTGTPNGNMLTYSEASGDRLHDNYLTWENVTYQTHNRGYACDNNADNFFRFNPTLYRRFRMTMRRNVGAGPAGVHHGRSCNSTGVSAVSRISDIFIW